MELNSFTGHIYVQSVKWILGLGCCVSAWLSSRRDLHVFTVPNVVSVLAR